uniref:Uncharacterized protein n=1 Tax=Callorhinchus milii TaxID=7868 RepID=A0A4W3K134_CALMI
MSTSGAREGPARQGAVGPRQPAPAQPGKRGRGRPRKEPQEPSGPPTPKRPRGRPRGSKNKEPRATQKKAEPPGEKRPRGRPRKWVSDVDLCHLPWTPGERNNLLFSNKCHGTFNIHLNRNRWDTDLMFHPKDGTSDNYCSPSIALERRIVSSKSLKWGLNPELSDSDAKVL